MPETNVNFSEAEKTPQTSPSSTPSPEVQSDDDHHSAHSLDRFEIGRVLFVAVAAAAIWFTVRPPIFTSSPQA